jgi:hypothetical protein
LERWKIKKNEEYKMDKLNKLRELYKGDGFFTTHAIGFTILAMLMVLNHKIEESIIVFGVSVIITGMRLIYRQNVKDKNDSKSSLGGHYYDETTFLPLQYGHQPGGSPV